MEQRQGVGHGLALMTILIWGTTFIATKVLLRQFTPVEILFFRFTLGLLALFLAKRARLCHTTKKQELTFAAAGLCGVCLYYLMENIALTYTTASNVGIILATVPFFTDIVRRIFFERTKEPLRPLFLLGFVVAMGGITIIHLQGAALHLNPKGDFLALAAGLVWAFYSNLTKKISSFGYDLILTTRRVFCYGMLFMIPAICLMDFHLGLERFMDGVIVANFLFLGFGACALCFVTWSYAVAILGSVKTCVYLYLSPVITMITSALVLQEPMTKGMIFGAALTLFGLILSEWRGQKKQVTVQQKR